MRRLLAIALPALLLVSAPAVTAAKEIAGGEVCGADGCLSIASPDERLLQGGPPVAGPTAREPFVRLEFRVGVPGHSEHASTLFLPHSGLVLADDGSTWMRPIAAEELRALARQVTAFPAGDLPASAPLAPAATQSSDGASSPWWIVVPAAVVALAGAAVIARRRRGGVAARPAGASG
jgi:MYXO-CTERM domain-containing protein